ncbi:MAG: hypothetical protein CVT86_03890, partial [Alphaproteobacteria bacterium HGW-Alphaproteobacteria-8]
MIGVRRAKLRQHQLAAPKQQESVLRVQIKEAAVALARRRYRVPLAIVGGFVIAELDRHVEDPHRQADPVVF